MKKILVPMDFSECSMAAAQMAMDIASKASAEIYFLHIHNGFDLEKHVKSVEVKIPNEERIETGKIKAALNKLVARAEKLGLKATPEIVMNNGIAWIEDFVLPYQIDFVVMGSHGAKGVKAALVGSNTQNLIRHSPVPVLVVKKKVENFEIKNIVFASDFRIDLIKPFKPIIELAKMWGATIRLLYVNTPYHFMESREVLFNMNRFMHQFRDTPHTRDIYNALDEERGIHDFVIENGVDVIALTTHGRTGFMKMLTHSIAESLIHHEDTPLLIMNIKSLLKS